MNWINNRNILREAASRLYCFCLFYKKKKRSFLTKHNKTVNLSWLNVSQLCREIIWRLSALTLNYHRYLWKIKGIPVITYYILHYFILSNISNYSLPPVRFKYREFMTFLLFTFLIFSFLLSSILHIQVSDYKIPLRVYQQLNKKIMGFP